MNRKELAELAFKDADDNFWYNCMFYSCEALEKMSEYENVVFE